MQADKLSMKLTSLILFLSSCFAFSNEIRVVDVRRNITLSDTDKIYKDYYINAGTEAGMKSGQTLTAQRKINIRDASGATNIGEILVPVGELKIIAVYERVTVARLIKLLDREALPMLEQTGIMAGDLVQLKK